MLDNQWLKQRLEYIWKMYFGDVVLANTVYVRFGRKAKTRLGSIKHGRKIMARGNKNTYITITGLFRNDKIPEYVLDAVLAHELSHYTHGFFSPHTRVYSHPHKHKIVDNELTKRGLGDILKNQKTWLKENWKDVIINNE